MRRIATYIHEQRGWPRLGWDAEALARALGEVRHRQGRLLGHMKALGFRLREEASLEALTEDVVKSSEIEGEKLNREDVRSSIARRLGVEIGGLRTRDRNVDGVVEMMLDATARHAQPLTRKRLFGWHTSLFPGGGSGLRKIRTGRWRDSAHGPMQVVSGAAGRERVHFEAPPAARVEIEMRAFLRWFNGGPPMDPVMKAGVSHLWFVTIHPFADGNGRITRAIADLCLARADRSAQRFYSMSAQIRQERGTYYAMLERTQRGGLDITEWLAWFLDCLGRAIEGGEKLLAGVLAKARFWEKVRDLPMNARQRSVLNRMLEGFEGKLTTTKWARLTKSSPDTALRDILDLVERKVLERSDSGGRSTSYRLAARLTGGV